VEAAHDEAVARRISERQGEALVATGVLERVEPDEPDALDRPATARLQNRRTRRQLVDLATDRVDLVDMSVEDRIEALALRSPGQAIEPAAQAPHLPPLDEDEDQQDEEGDAEADDDRAEDGLDGGVQVDRSILPAGREGADRKASRAGRV
jgi:hypothetical protein